MPSGHGKYSARFQPCSHPKHGTASPQDEPGRELLMEPKVAQPTQLLMPRDTTRAPSPSAKVRTHLEFPGCSHTNSTDPEGVWPQSPAPSQWRSFTPGAPGSRFLTLIANPPPQEQGPSWHESLRHLFINDIPTCLSPGQLKEQVSRDKPKMPLMSLLRAPRGWIC